MDYQGHIIRPPSEAGSIILQVTVGCSHNKCTFCGAYKGQRFTIKNDDILNRDIAFAARQFRNRRRMFLCDGDVMIIPHQRLLRILAEIRETLPWITRVGIYANAKSLKHKTVEELKELKSLGLGIVYMGLESGDDATLENVCKSVDSADIVAQGWKVRQSGIKLNVTVILGLAGPERSDVHARETGRALSDMNPDHVGALTLMLIPGTPLHRDWEAGQFILMKPKDLLKELRTMIIHTHLSRGLFFANHASNYLPIRARLPRDKESTIHLIDRALDERIPLKPDWMRAL